MGVCVGSAVVPIAFAITWKKCTAFAAVSGALGGLAGAVVAWVLTAKFMTGSVTIDTLGGDYPMLAGNLVAIFLSGIISTVLSYIKPQEYDWADLQDIPLGASSFCVAGPNLRAEALPQAGPSAAP
jgi:Na+/proline symporter